MYGKNANKTVFFVDGTCYHIWHTYGSYGLKLGPKEIRPGQIHPESPHLGALLSQGVWRIAGSLQGDDFNRNKLGRLRQSQTAMENPLMFFNPPWLLMSF